MKEVFHSPNSLKAKLQESFPADVPTGIDFRVGYFLGNSKQWIFEDKDLDLMYWCCPKGSKITIWCF